VIHRFCLILCVSVMFLGCKSESAPIPSQDQPVAQEELAQAVAESPTTVASEPSVAPKQAEAVATEKSVLILAWNVESGGANPKKIAERLARFAAYDVFCLSEVHPSDFKTYQDALGDQFDSVPSKSGNEDRLQILFNQQRFELLEKIELDRYREYVLNSGGHRSPTAVRLKDRATMQTFIVMVNHLARGNAAFRKGQAIGLREWARDQATGIINVGDFNMDYEFATRKGNDALDEILRDNVWKWIEPKAWIDSNWWDPEGDGIDNFEGSLLDFVFVSGPAKTWKPQCEVIVEDGDFPDDATTSDHRPVSIQFELGI
jgi:endonuclease/exonuclease/phosphatase family metal-dependent hydrolase